MERLTVKKKLAIVRLYFSSLSYDKIAARSGVGKGTVTNVITELKAGTFAEAADVGEHIQLLSELSIDLKRLKLTPGQCATGLLLLNRINECGLDPTDIDRWPVILKSVRNEDDAREFVHHIYSIQEVQERTGLDLEALDNIALDLERKAADLEPTSNRLKDCKKQFAELTKRREKLNNSVAILEQKNELLTPHVKELEKREQNLSGRIADVEPKAKKAEMTLATLKREMQKHEDLGFTLQGLIEFNERIQVIAQRHTIEPAKLKTRLLDELETLDKGLALETLIGSRRQELDKVKQDINKGKKEIETTRAVVDNLKQEKTNLVASIKEIREEVGREIVKIIPLAQDTIDKLGEELRRGNEGALTEVRRLRDEAIEVGKDMGRYEGILKSYEWLDELPALMLREDNVEGKRVKVIALSVTRALHVWT